MGGALGDHPQGVVIALELSLSLERLCRHQRVDSGWGALCPFSLWLGQPGFAPSLQTTPVQPEQ